MHLLKRITFSCAIILSQTSYSQNNYWKESFESTLISGTSPGATTPTDVNLPTSGIWKIYYAYRGSSGVCNGKPLRLLNTSTSGLSSTNTSFAITPTFSNGVGQLFFVENSAAARTVAIYKSTDGTTFTFLRNVVTGGATCDTTLLTINDATITKLKFTNETTSNIGLDNMAVSKNGTLLDGTPVPPVVIADSTPYYPDNTALLPAFPGAEGAGKYTRGGRGGVIVEVTNLFDDAAGTTVGSFRWAQKQNVGPKTIVFRVSGTIHLAAALSFARGDMTIAGQTAPGDGICFADFPMTVGKSNIIFRYVRFRLGDIGINRTGYASSAADAFNSGGGASADSIIIDHCTASWSIDESATFKNMTHFTMQNCLISEPLNQSDHSGELHGYGGIWGGVNATFHHNLFAHCSNRSCRFNGSRQYTNGEQDTVDYRNNVIYDWGINTVYGGEGGFYNIVNNYYKPGPSTNASVMTRTLNPYKDGSLPYGKYYMTGNIMTSSQEVTDNNWLGVKMEDGLTPLGDTGLSKNTYQIKTYHVTTHTAQDAYNYVLSNAGAILPRRDTVDQRIINEVVNGLGHVVDCQGGYPAFTDSSISINAWPTLGQRAPAADNDHDGMADEWELQRGLNPALATDRNGIAPNGYTNLENFLNGDSTVAFGSLNTCVPLPAIVTTGSNAWLGFKDTSFVRLISSDTTNMVVSIKDAAGYGNFTASYYTVNSNRTFKNAVYLNRNVSIVPANPSAITAPVLIRFYFTKNEFNALQAANSAIKSLSDLRILKISDNSCQTTLSGTITEITPSATGTFGTYANGYYVEFSTSTFSTFFLGSSQSVLPLTLLSFKANVTNQEVKTVWTTTNEINTKDFTVQRSTDGINFKNIGIVPAQNQTGSFTYSFTDAAPLAGLSYYRLLSSDKDGSFTFSNIASVEINAKSLLIVSPNPVDDNLFAKHPKALYGASISILTADGKLIATYQVSQDQVQTTIPSQALPSGVYIIRFNNGSAAISKTFIKN